jgi:hypothetical protein
MSRLLLGLLVCLLGLGPSALLGQSPATAPVINVDTGEDLPLLAAWSPDGLKLAYGTEKEVERQRHPMTVGEESIQRYPGEVWVTDFRDKPKRILKHGSFRDEKGELLNFYVTGLAWSPDGQQLAAELTDERKQSAVFLFTVEGKPLKIGSGGGNSLPGYGAAWLGQGESLGVLREAAEPRLLHRVQLLRVRAGRLLPLFGPRTFQAVAWLPKASQAVLVERDREFSQPPQLLLGDLERGTTESLGEVSEYLGGLATTADEKRFSYFAGGQKLVVRGLDRKPEPETLPVPLGHYQWVGGEIFYIEPKEIGRRQGWLAHLDPTTGEKQRLVEELVQGFWPAPNGRRVAVLTVGLKPALKIYSLSAD